MGKYLILIVVLLLIACGKSDEKPDEQDASSHVIDKYNEASIRLRAGFLDNGFVVSISDTGVSKHQGDALIWSGVALSAMTCSDGVVIEDALIKMILELDGGLYRHPSLKSEISMDGALGLYNGLAHRFTRCPQLISKWKPALKLHKEFMDNNRNRLNPNSSVSLPDYFPYVRDLIFWKSDLISKPSNKTLLALENEVAAWSLAVKLKKQPCFRIHLSYLAIDAVSELDGVTTSGRNKFCSATKGTDLPIIDNYCGRGDLVGWIDDFEYNKYEYRHQRCGGWESADADDDKTPGVDLLKAISEAYKI
jgi:hypothetical protein